MRRPLVLVACACLWAWAAASYGQQPADTPGGRMLSQVAGSLARLQMKVQNELTTVMQENGLAVCINAADGVFLTRDIPGQVPLDELKELRLSAPGARPKEFNADLLGLDPETNLAFLRIFETNDKGEHVKPVKHPWTELKFEAQADLRCGQPVYSVGLLGPQTGNAPYLGAGTVSALLRLPGQIAYVSGELTNSSSPVLDEKGRVIGMVGGQLPVEYRMLLGGRWADVGLSGRQRTLFFVPVDDFRHVLANPPSPGRPRQLPWIGVINFEAISPETAEVIKVTGKPAVLVGQVVPDGPAFKARIEQGDAIVGLNGAPLEELPTPELTAANFERALIQFRPGQKVTLAIVRKGQPGTVEAVLEPMPPRPYEAPRYYNKQLGFGARDLVVLDKFANRPTELKDKGAVVTMLRENSPAAKGQLRPGDLITSVNKKPTPDVAELQKQVTAAMQGSPGAQIEFMILRGNLVNSVLIKPEPE